MSCTGREASPIDFSRFECSLKSTACHCLATWALRAPGYYSDGFLMQELAQRNVGEQLPLQNRDSQGSSPHFIPCYLKRKKKKRERGYRQGEPTHCKELDDQLHFFYTIPQHPKANPLQ